MSGRRSKNKGKRGEREAASEVSRLFGVEARRGVQYQGGPDSPDIVADLPGLHFEVKRTETLSIYTAMDQARSDAGDDIPVVLHRRNGKKWLCVVELDDLPALVSRLFLVLTENQ